jgi:exopolysaccharide biosynthesis WecB/TagA/CpsF family protein
VSTPSAFHATSALATKSKAVPILAHVDGWPIHLDTLPRAVDEIVKQAKAGLGFTVFTLNLDHLVKLRTSTAFQAAYRKADLVTADGAPVARLARRQNADIERTTGADMFLPLASAAAAKDLPVYLFGATSLVLTTVSHRLKQHTHGKIEIAGSLAPSATFDPQGPEADAAIALIKASGARLCFVALGAPKQEVFAARAVAKGCKAGFVCVGAAVDFVAGTQVRAPGVFQRYGLEWAWRLANNPRRLAKRYADCASVLVDVAVLAPLRRQFVGREV